MGGRSLIDSNVPKADSNDHGDLSFLARSRRAISVYSKRNNRRRGKRKRKKKEDEDEDEDKNEDEERKKEGKNEREKRKGNEKKMR